MPRIDADTLLRDLRELARFGAFGTGVHRPTYSADDVAARAWFGERLEAAGLAVEIDGIGNLLGRAPGPGRRLLVGSHLETQPHAGWLDGALGCVYGLALARTFAQAEPTLRGRIDVVAFADEEGHFGSRLGSRSFIGELDEAAIDVARNRDDGRPLRQALSEAGYAGRPRLLAEPGRYDGFVEAHIEQGDNLEANGLRLGIVTTIVGLRQFRVTVDGVQNHAGTTRMAVRKDAGVVLVRLADTILDRFPDLAGERTVWTIGRIQLVPGAPSVVPGRAEMDVQFRDASPDRLDALESALTELVRNADRAGPCRVALETTASTLPVEMDARLQQALEDAARRVAPDHHQRMPSMAGHDAQIVAARMPAAMLFVPSIGGISHHAAENTSDSDIVLGCEALAEAAAALLAGS